MQPEEHIIELSELQIKQFSQHPVWREVCELIKEAIDNAHDDLETPGLDPIRTEFCRGRLEMAKRLLTLPAEMIHILREQRKEAGEDTEENKDEREE